MRVLITRPAREAQSLATILAAEGHGTIVSPLLEIQFVEGAPISLGGFQAVVATSANGVHALAQRTSERGAQLFAVGPETVTAACKEGFQTAAQLATDARTLAHVVQQSAHPDNGPLLYAAGRDRTGHLEIALAELGFAVHIEVLYAAKALPLSEQAIAALQSGKVNAAMLFSARSARLFSEQITHHRLQQACDRVAALCLSPAVTAALDMKQFADVRVAVSPNRESMLALLREFSSGRP